MADARTDWLHFAATGTIGPLHVGLVRAAVRLHCGKPDLWGCGRSMKRARIWKFGDLEVHFNGDDIGLLFSDTFEETIQIDPTRNIRWPIGNQTSLKKLTAALLEAQIPHTTADDKVNANCVLVRTRVGTEFLFDFNDDGDSARLCVVSFDTRSL